MRITFIIGGLGIGGKEKQLFYLLKYLPTEIKKQLIVLSNLNKFDDISSLVNDLILIDKQKKYKLSTILTIYKRVNDFSPDIIHSWDFFSPFMMKPLCVYKRIKLINGVNRSANPHIIGSRKYIINKLRARISDANVANSQKGLIAKGLAGQKKSLCIYNGFDLAFFDDMQKKHRLQNEVPENTLNICMVASFSKAKDYFTFINVAKNLSKININIFFWAIGDGETIIKSKKLVNDLLLKNFKFFSVRNDVPVLLKYCKIGVLLNPDLRGEGFSNAIMEYMAARLPVIATNAGGTPELIQDGVNGYLVDPGDTKTIVKKILYLINNQNQAKLMGQAGRKMIEDSFPVTGMVNSYIKLYNKLVKI